MLSLVRDTVLFAVDDLNGGLLVCVTPASKNTPFFSVLFFTALHCGEIGKPSGMAPFVPSFGSKFQLQYECR